MDLGDQQRSCDNVTTAATNNAQDRLIAVVYDELKQIARAHRRGEQFNITLQTTALVHEAWLRLAQSEIALRPQNEAHLKALSSRIIRNVLVDYSRYSLAQKRQPDANDVRELRLALIEPGVDVDVLDLDRALHALGAKSPRLVQLVEYRFFGGMSTAETAEVMQLSTRTIEREWQKAHAYLLAELRGERS